MSEARFPSLPGTYVLWLELAAPVTLPIGRLGVFAFPAGAYGYVGSARGPGGVAGRLRHHLARAERLHWHIDALRLAAPVSAVWWCADDVEREHPWASALARLPGAFLPAPRFGASDCHCPAHLVGIARRPALADFQRVAGGDLHGVSVD